jgi:hypothetical protein
MTEGDETGVRWTPGARGGRPAELGFYVPFDRGRNRMGEVFCTSRRVEGRGTGLPNAVWCRIIALPTRGR